MTTIDHYIQRGILRSLSAVERISFAELKPKGLENNLFVYHLNQLLRSGLVAKGIQGYYLTSDGLRYVARVTRTNLDLRILPTLISLLVIQNEYDEYAMHARAAQPFLGYFTFPGGILRFNEELSEHAMLQLYEKIGFTIDLQLRGTASLRLGDATGVLTHAYAQVFYGRVSGRPDIASLDVRFTPQWVDITQPQVQILADVPLILHKLHNSTGHFFLESMQTIAPLAQPAV